jgi:hypothetical protein
MVLKTRKLSFWQSTLSNFNLIFGMAWIVLVSLVISYFSPLNHGFLSRNLTFLHFGWQSVPFAIIMLAFDQVRKYFVRSVKSKDNKPNWFERNTYW